jgi:hypothetical protein
MTEDSQQQHGQPRPFKAIHVEPATTAQTYRPTLAQEHVQGVSRVVESRLTPLTVAGLMAPELIRTVLDLVDIVVYLVVFDTLQVLPTSCHPIRNSASDL